MEIQAELIKEYLDNQKFQVVETYDFNNKRIKYSDKIKCLKIDNTKGYEEVVRAYFLAKLINELGYKLENIEIEKNTKSGDQKKARLCKTR